MDTQRGSTTPSAVQVPDVADIGTEDIAQSGLSKQLRRLITGLMVLLLVSVSAPWWFSVARNEWTRIFPPPPYTGSLIFIQSGLQIKALRTSDGQTQWIDSGIIASPPLVVVSDMVVYSDGVSIIAVHTTDGSAAWHTPVPQGDYSTPLLQGDTSHLYLWLPSSNDTSQSLFESLDPHSGKVNWRYSGNGRLTSLGQPADMQTLVYCDITADANASSLTIAASVLDSATGVVRWMSSPAQSSPTQPLDCLPTDHQVLLAQFRDLTTDLTVFDRMSSAHLWEHELPGIVTTNDATTLYMTTWLLSMSPTAQHLLTAYDLTTGQQRWQMIGDYTALLFDTTSFARDIIMMKTPTGLAGIDARQGTLIWQLQPPGDELQQWTALRGDGDVIFYQDLTTITAIHATTGTVLWRFPLPQNGQQSSDNQLFFGHHRLFVSERNKLIAIDPASGHVVWQDMANFEQVIAVP